MAKKNSVTIRVCPEFKEMWDKILAKKPRKVKTSRISKAYLRHPLNKKILKDIELTELK